MLKTLSLHEAMLLYGYEDEPRKDKGKRHNVYEPYIKKITQMLTDGHTVAHIHREINTQENLNYHVETLRHLIHWKLKDHMPAERRWANQHGVCRKGIR